MRTTRASHERRQSPGLTASLTLGACLLWWGLSAQPVLAAGTVTDCTDFGAPDGLAAALGGGGNVDFACSGTLLVPEILITSDTTLDATGRAVTLSGNDVNRVLHVAPGASLTLVNLTLANGRSDDIPGTGVYGGGIYNEGTLTLQQSRVLDSAADSGGGIYNAATGALRAYESLISGNQTIQPTCPEGYVCGGANFEGGGIYNAAGTVELVATSVTGNTAQSTGGGIFNSVRCVYVPLLPDCVATRNLMIRDSTIAENSAGVGGGIISNFGAFDVINSTIANNSARLSGGGIRIVTGAGDESPLVRLEQSTVAGNQATGCTGLCGGGFSISGSLIANNVGGNCGSWVIDSHYNLSSDATCGFTHSSSANGVDPLLLPLGNYGGRTPTLALAANSPAIDKGGECGLLFDQRGAARNDPSFVGAPLTCDIGAFEHAPGKGVTAIAADFNRPSSVIPIPSGSTPRSSPARPVQGPTTASRPRRSGLAPTEWITS